MVLKPGSSFTPTQISGLALWLDASDAATLTLDGSNNVSQWADKSGNARHVLQGVVNSRPKLVAGGIGSKNVLEFDGTDDFLKSGAFTVTAPGIIYTVIRSFAASGTNRNAIDGFDNANNRWAIGDSYAVGDIRPWAFVPGGTIRATTTANVLGTTAKYLTMKFKTGEAAMRVNGTSYALAASIGTVPDFQGINVGQYNGSLARYQGYIAEILIYQGEHDATQIGNVEGYLAGKWGL